MRMPTVLWLHCFLSPFHLHFAFAVLFTFPILSVCWRSSCHFRSKLGQLLCSLLLVWHRRAYGACVASLTSTGSTIHLWLQATLMQATALKHRKIGRSETLHKSLCFSCPRHVCTDAFLKFLEEGVMAVQVRAYDKGVAAGEVDIMRQKLKSLGTKNQMVSRVFNSFKNVHVVYIFRLCPFWCSWGWQKMNWIASRNSTRRKGSNILKSSSTWFDSVSDIPEKENNMKEHLKNIIALEEYHRLHRWYIDDTINWSMILCIIMHSAQLLVERFQNTFLYLRLEEAHERVEQAKEEARFEASKACKSPERSRFHMLRRLISS